MTNPTTAPLVDPVSDKKRETVRQRNVDLDLALDRYCEAAETTRSVRRGPGLRDWAMYTAAAGSALAATQSADAAVIYSGVQNIMVTRTAASTGFQTGAVDLNGDSVDDFGLSLVWNSFNATAGLAGLFGAGGAYMLTSSTGSFGGKAQRLSSSSYLNSGLGNLDNQGLLRFANVGGASAGNWPGGNPTATSGFAGIGFFDTGGDFHLGWLRLAIRNDANGLPDKITLVDWAYESVDGDPIHIGSIPEPSSLALLAAGAAGVAAFRRRRNRADD